VSAFTQTELIAAAATPGGAAISAADGLMRGDSSVTFAPWAFDLIGAA